MTLTFWMRVLLVDGVGVVIVTAVGAALIRRHK
jgi:hypothetical protein